MFPSCRLTIDSHAERIILITVTQFNIHGLSNDALLIARSSGNSSQLRGDVIFLTPESIAVYHYIALIGPSIWVEIYSEVEGYHFDVALVVSEEERGKWVIPRNWFTLYYLPCTMHYLLCFAISDVLSSN